MGLGMAQQLSTTTAPRTPPRGPNTVLSGQPAGTTSQSQMAGDRATAPDAAGGQGAAGWLVNAMRNLGKPPTYPVGSNSIAPVIGGVVNGGANGIGNSIGVGLAGYQGAAQGQNATDYWRAFYGADLAKLAQSKADIEFQQGQINDRYNSQADYLRGNYGIQQQQLQGEQERNVGLKYNDLYALNAYLDQINGLKTNQYSVNQDYLRTQGTMADVGLREQLAGTSQQRGLADRGYGLTYNAANTANINGIRDVMSNGASGGFGTGQDTVKRGLNQTLEQQLAAAQLTKDTTYQGLGAQDQAAQLANTNAHLGFANQANNLFTQQGIDKAGYDKAKADAANQKNFLDSMAKDYGLQADQLKLQMENALKNLGYDSDQALNQLANAAASNNAQQTAQAAVIAQQIMHTAPSFSTTRPSTPTKTPIRGIS